MIGKDSRIHLLTANAMGCLTRNYVRFAGTTATVPILADPTSTQREAFQLIGAAIPLALK